MQLVHGAVQGLERSTVLATDEEAADEPVQSLFYEMPLLEVYLEAHSCAAEEEWLERWSCRWRRRRKAHCYWVAGWMRESFSQWQGITLATVVMEVLVSERKRELCGGGWEAHGGVKKAEEMVYANWF